MSTRATIIGSILLTASACTSLLDGGSASETDQNEGSFTGSSAGTGESGGATAGGGMASGGGAASGSAPGAAGGASSTGGSATSTGAAPGEGAVCGNGIAEENESCDGNDLGDADCSSLGFSGGALACTECRFDTIACQGGKLVTEPRTFCSDTCWKPEYVNDGRCWDGGANSDFNTCAFGTDCSDCGSQTIDVPVVSGGGRAACGQTTFGVNEGDPAEDWTTFNQYGAAVSLSDFCGKWVYMEVGAIWCPVCRSHAPELEDLANELGAYADGLVVVDALYEVLNPIKPNATETPLVPELMEWAEEFGQVKVHAVSDADYEIWGRYWPLEDTDNPPRGMLINPAGEIERIGQANASMIKSAMDR